PKRDRLQFADEFAVCRHDGSPAPQSGHSREPGRLWAVVSEKGDGRLLPRQPGGNEHSRFGGFQTRGRDVGNGSLSRTTQVPTRLRLRLRTDAVSKSIRGRFQRLYERRGVRTGGARTGCVVAVFDR